MAAKQYQKYLKPLKIVAPPPGAGGFNMFRNTGNADVNRWLNGRDHLEGVALNFSWGFYTGLGDWHPGMDPHVHPYPECLVFVGLDPDRPEYLGAKLQYALGKELEIHNFDKPTCVVAPAGFFHCPSVTMDVTSPIGYSFFIISLGAGPVSRWLGDGVSEEQIKRMAAPRDKNAPPPPMDSSFGAKRVHFGEEMISHGHLYDKNMVPLVPNNFAMRKLKAGEKALYGDFANGKYAPGPGLTENAAWLFGKDLGGMKLNFCWGIHKNPGAWLRGPANELHTHPNDEVMVFAGTEPADVDWLGAEIQIDLGPEHERYIINEPTAVVIPAGMPHGNIVTRWVDRPFGLLLMSLAEEHETKYVE
jgi:hypothetical protein